MATPSFEEMLSEARRIGAARTRAQDFSTANVLATVLPQLAALGLTMPSGRQETFAGEINPATLETTPYSEPRQTGRSLLDVIRGVPKMGKTEGIPLTSEEFKDVFVKRAGQKPDKTPVVVGYDKKTGTFKEVYRGQPGEDVTTAGYGDADDGKGDKVMQRQDEAARSALAMVKNYYTQLRGVQGNENLGMGKSLKLGVEGISSRAPIFGRAMLPDASQLTGWRSAQGARLAKAMKDAGNIALAEQKNALELLSPPGTRDVDVSEKQALATILENITNRTPEEETLYQEALKGFDVGKGKFKLGEIRQVQGKGTYKYIGNNKWQKMKS